MAFLGSCRNLKSKLHAKAAFNKLKEHADKPALASAYVLMPLWQKFLTWQELKQMVFQISLQTISRRLDTTTATVYVAPRQCIELEMWVWCLTHFVVLLESVCLAVLDVPSAPYRANFMKVSSGSTDSAFVMTWSPCRVVVPGPCARSELYERLGQGEKARDLEAERLSLGLVKQRGESYLHLAGLRRVLSSTVPQFHSSTCKNRCSFDSHCFHWVRVIPSFGTTCQHLWPLVTSCDHWSPLVITVARDMCCVSVFVCARWWLPNLCGRCWKPWGESHHRWLQRQNQGRWLQALWEGPLRWQHKWWERFPWILQKMHECVWTSSNMILQMFHHALNVSGTTNSIPHVPEAWSFFGICPSWYWWSKRTIALWSFWKESRRCGLEHDESDESEWTHQYHQEPPSLWEA